MTNQLPGIHAAPNIQSAPDIYEIEKRAVDPEGRIEAAMWQIAPWQDKIFLDLGAGTGFHIPRFHACAAHVFAIEPHDASRLRAMERVARQNLERASVMTGSAEKTFLADASIDVIHARFAYFFAPHCEPGLRELERIIRPGGTAFIIDNDLRYGTFAQWLRRLPLFADISADVVENFWEEHGFALLRIPSEWRFQKRADLEAVMRLEFGDTLAGELLAEHEGLSVEYHYDLYYRRY
jgi:SAM-dependent methyltransferase